MTSTPPNVSQGISCSLWQLHRLLCSAISQAPRRSFLILSSSEDLAHFPFLHLHLSLKPATMFFSISSLIAASLALVASASPVEQTARDALVGRATEDVWSPHILTPNAGTVWVIGQSVNVTWWVFAFPPSRISDQVPTS